MRALLLAVTLVAVTGCADFQRHVDNAVRGAVDGVSRQLPGLVAEGVAVLGNNLADKIGTNMAGELSNLGATFARSLEDNAPEPAEPVSPWEQGIPYAIMYLASKFVGDTAREKILKKKESPA